jgi:DNA-binding CsgD family transcriptional regulator
MKFLSASGDALLSAREIDVVRCVAEGLSNREIAQRLSLREHTVKNYLFRIFDKLGVSSRVEVVLYALGNHAAAAKSDDAAPSKKETTPATLPARMDLPVRVMRRN